MKIAIKRMFKVLGGFLAVALLFAIIFYGYYKWIQTRTYEEKITVTAYYMKYACGDCSLEMEVQAVNNKNYKFIIGKEILPTPKTRRFEELCDFISSIGFETSIGPNSIEQSFFLMGHLHKNSHGLPFFECSEAPFFTVEKIKYGKNGKWKDF